MLALTMGDPAGIGPEIAAKAWEALRDTGPAFVLIGDPYLWHQRAQVAVIDQPGQARFAEALPVMPLALAVPVTPGHPDPASAPAVIASIEHAVRRRKGETFRRSSPIQSARRC